MPTNISNVTARRFVDRTVVGTPDQVAAVLRSTMDNGRLVAATPPRPVANAPDMVIMRIRLHPSVRDASEPARRLAPISPVPTHPVAPAKAGRWRRRTGTVAALSVLAVGVLAGLVYLVWLAVRALISALPMLAGAALVLAVLWAVLGRAGVCCPGLHCPGCRHG